MTFRDLWFDFIAPAFVIGMAITLLAITFYGRG